MMVFRFLLLAALVRQTTRRHSRNVFENTLRPRTTSTHDEYLSNTLIGQRSSATSAYTVRSWVRYRKSHFKLLLSMSL